MFVHGMLACAWSRTRIQVLLTESHGGRLYAHQADLLDRDEFTFTSSPGIRNRDVRVAEIVARELVKAKPDKWGCVQARELWSPQEERSEYELGASGLPRAYVSPQQPWKN